MSINSYAITKRIHQKASQGVPVYTTRWTLEKAEAPSNGGNVKRQIIMGISAPNE